MAVCYHDKQDFKSDLNIEVAREGDILEADQDLKDRKCDKNPGHQGFIPFKDLTLEHLPNEIKSTYMLDTCKIIGSMVVKLVVDKIQNGKRIVISGSGYVSKSNNVFRIRTNNHIVNTDNEIKACTVEFNYDSTDRSKVLTSRGVKCITTCAYRDITLFTFHPVPDFLHGLYCIGCKCKQPSIVIMYKDCKIVTMKDVVHTVATYRSPSNLSQLLCPSPHDLNSSLIHLMFISCPDDSVTYLKSPCFKFQPIPSNIQELNSIEIHIHEDDGKSSVIPGDVVKFGDEFFVEISKSIFQDEVKKCRLVLNGEVIGRGTRLYFQQFKPSDIFKGVDLEHSMKGGRDKWWIIGTRSIPRDELSVITCCIGHPHGGIKMVTFGRLLDMSYERFDNKYEHITQPDKDCQCKEVNCVKYSCKTCPGSSGSPVFELYEGRTCISSFCHFYGKKEEEILSNGERIDNKNLAWTFTPPS